MCRGVEDEYPLRLECDHREEGCPWRAIGHCVAYRKVLELQQDVVSARWALVPPEVPIDPQVPAVGIPPGPAIAHLHQPRPDGCAGSVDGHGMRRFQHGMGHDVIVWQGSMDFSISRSP